MLQKNATPEKEVFANMFQEMFTLLSKIHRISEDLLINANSEMTHSCWVILCIIGREPECLTVPQIAELRSTSRQAVQRQISLLLDQGLIEAIENPKNKRSPLYRMTPEGQEYEEAVSEEVYGNWLANISEKMGIKEGERLLESLKGLSETINEIPIKSAV